MDFVETFSIPTPYNTGSVNCYLFSDGITTLLDPGPKFDEAYQTLVENLNETDHRIEDIERVLITHPHPDHFGMAKRISEYSDASIIAHKDATDQLVNPMDYFKREQAYFRPFLHSMGVPKEVVDPAIQIRQPNPNYQDPVPIDRKITQDTILNIGFNVKCIHTPGHSPGSVCYAIDSESAIFTGDHVLSNITPNPLLTLAPENNNERTRSLPTYLLSLRKLLYKEKTVGYGGHQDRIPDLRERVVEIIHHHHVRKEQIFDLLEQSDSATPYDIMNEMYPKLSPGKVFLGMSEIIGHLDLLENEGRISINDDNEEIHYRIKY